MELLKEDTFIKNLCIIDVFKKHNIKIIDKITDLKTTKKYHILISDQIYD